MTTLRRTTPATLVLEAIMDPALERPVAGAAAGREIAFAAGRRTALGFPDGAQGEDGGT